jgi:ABC-type oligopeptide transport system substrate-binding subunit
MTSHGKTRPFLAIAMMAAVAAGIAACGHGSSGTQYSNNTPVPVYSNSNSGPSSDNSNPNEPASINWQNNAQQNANNAIDDMGPGGTADPVDEGNSVSYSGDDSGN